MNFINWTYISNKAVFLGPFLHMAKTQDKKFNILRTERDFKVKLKVFFVIFKGFPVAKNCLRPGSALLNKPAAKSFESCRFV